MRRSIDCDGCRVSVSRCECLSIFARIHEIMRMVARKTYLFGQDIAAALLSQSHLSIKIYP